MFSIEGKGYSTEFTDHMGMVLSKLEKAPDQMIRLVLTTDVVCANCPNNISGLCTSQDKVIRYDEGTLKACDLSERDVIPYSELLALIKERIIDSKQRSSICGDCCWDHICRNKEISDFNNNG